MSVDNWETTLVIKKKREYGLVIYSAELETFDITTKENIARITTPNPYFTLDEVLDGVRELLEYMKILLT